MNTGIEELTVRNSALADAFSAFVNAAGRLEHSYSSLQAEVAELRQELKKRDAQLASSLAENQRVRQALHCIVEALPCGVVVLDENNEMVLSNPEAHTLLNEPGGSMVQRRPAPVLVQKMLGAVGRGDGPEAEQELRIDEAAGTRWLAVRKRTIQVPGLADCGTKDGVVLIARDITAHKEVEQQREQNRNMVALSEVAGVLAHEIRNPLASLELFSGLLVDQDLNSDARGWVENIRAGVRLMSATVNNVLSLHSLGTPQLVPVRIGDLLASSISFVQPLAKQAEVEAILKDETGDARIAADSNRFRQVVLNLACNAFKFTPCGGRLLVSARVSDGKVVIQFADTGAGIAPGNLERIFEAGFSRGNSLGLGLAICRKIVEQHGGTIGVTSQSGKGATFTMEFPSL
jgi:two-component system sensor histidine kinase FlrB